MSSTEIILGLGSNMGNRLENLNNALHLITKHLGVITARSKIYESKPVDYLAQDKFLNMVTLVKLENYIKARDLLALTQSIEQNLGRKKTIPKGPRNIDIDILYYENLYYSDSMLTIPHPAMSNRDFVMFPLQELREKALVIDIPLPGINLVNDLLLYNGC